MIRPLLICCLLAVAVWQITAATGVHAKAWLGQVLLERAWSRSLASEQPVAPWPDAISYPVARLQVPALEIDHLVLKGADTPVLAWGPGMEVGPSGHRIIAAHRDTHFRFLDRLNEGERVQLDLVGGDIEHWRVVDQRVVDARITDINLAASGDQMTWVTCWPLDAIEAGGPFRLLVTLSKTIKPDQRTQLVISNSTGVMP